MHLATGFATIAAIAPLLLPHVLALPSPNPQPDFFGDIKNTWDKITGQEHQSNAGNTAEQNLAGNATLLSQSFGALLDGDPSNNVEAIIALAKSGEDWFQNIQSHADEIAAHIPNPAEDVRKAKQALKDVVEDIKNEFKEIKEDLKHPAKLVGDLLAKIRAASAKMACKLQNDVFASINTLITESNNQNKDNPVVKPIPQIQISKDVQDDLGLDMSKCTVNAAPGNPTPTPAPAPVPTSPPTV